MAKTKTIKLKDVAQAAGVDASTVSRVLNNQAAQRVAADTRGRILAKARELGYQPNPLARGLRTSRTHALGIAVPQLDNPVFAQIIIGATDAAHMRGYELIVTLVTDLSAGPAVYERLAQTHRVDGLLVSTLEKDDVLLKALERASVPCVVVNRQVRGVENSVAHDSFEAARQSTEYLISIGHRRIAHLAGRLNGYNGTRRLAGYRAALEAAGIKPDMSLVAEAGYTLEGGERAMRKILEVRQRPTAVMAATVMSAAGALRVLHARKIKVPDEISVMSIHDVQIAEMLFPPLTTLRLPLQEMGKVATDGLIDLLEGKTRVVSRVLEPEQLIVRESTAPPRRRQSG
jgi:LacI family transcriptional regulator